MDYFFVNNNNNNNNVNNNNNKKKKKKKKKYIFHTSIGADLLKFTSVLILLNTLNEPFRNLNVRMQINIEKKNTLQLINVTFILACKCPLKAPRTDPF